MSDLKNESYERHRQESDKVSKGDVLPDLMIALFQAAHPLAGDDPGESLTDKVQYVKYCASDIDRLGRVLKFLGLAETNQQSMLGWTPTARLVHIIAERAARPTKGSATTRATKKERRVIDSLLQLAGGQTEQVFTDDFLFNVLNSLGFLRESGGGECRPTALLREVLENLFQV
jgi:hypothetical protein